MTDFKVGDRVRLDSDGQPVLTVTDTGQMFQGDGYFIFKDDRGRWHRGGDHFTLVPPEKPKYRVVHHDFDVAALDLATALEVASVAWTEATGVRFFTPTWALTAILTAMTSLGYEEAS